MKGANQKKMDFSYNIITDTREKRNEHIIDGFNNQHKPYRKQKLNIGDYAIEGILPSGEIYIPKVVVERKHDIDELLQNLLETKKIREGKLCTRVEAELNRAYVENYKVVILIEDPDFQRKLLTGAYTTNANSPYARSLIYGLEAKYSPNVSYRGCSKAEAPGVIFDILYRQLKYELYLYTQVKK